MVSFNLNRRKALADRRPTTSNNTDGEENVQQQQYSFAAGVLAASIQFRPFNPSFSRRRPRPTNKPVSPRAMEAGKRHHGEQKSSPSISFAIFHDTAYTMAMEDYTYEEIEATWYSREELAVIEVDRQECVRLMEVGIELDDVKFSSRGLEKSTGKGLASSRRNVKLGQTVIHEEQETETRNLWANEGDAVVRMAASYAAASSACAKDAHRVGLREMLANHKYLVSDNEACRPTTSEANANTESLMTRIASAA